jgi:hypothetical protein
MNVDILVSIREGHWLRVFENRVLRGIFQPEREEGTRLWRKLCNKKLHQILLGRLNQGFDGRRHVARMV